MGTWLWKKERNVHFFVYDQRMEMREMVKYPMVAGIERTPADLEAQIMENLVPKLAERLTELKVRVKYVVIAPVGVLYSLGAKINKVIGISLGLGFYQRKPKFLKKEKVVDYVPQEYEPLGEIKVYKE